MRLSDIDEAFSLGRMPPISHNEYQKAYAPIYRQSTKVSDVRENLELFCHNKENYLLVKDESIVIGNLRLTPTLINGKRYLNVEAIFVDPMYRKTSATHWLIYAVKETADSPIIADGAIFSDGISLINSLRKHKYASVSKINTITGEVHPLDDQPINDQNFAYIFESAKLGFGKDVFEGTELPYVWYPLFEEIR